MRSETAKPCLDRILNQLMANRKISISRLARETGVPKSSLFEWTTGRAPRNLGDIRRIAAYFQISLHYLIFGEEDPFSGAPGPGSAPDPISEVSGASVA
jgi:transcriptional regulator with XRE-family HTH domain